jgi:hypothetical protein
MEADLMIQWMSLAEIELCVALARPHLRGVVAVELAEVTLHATEIKLRAERRTGELLREMGKHPGYRGDRVVTAPRLRELGISKRQSSAWQRLSEIPEAALERHLKSGWRPCGRRSPNDRPRRGRSGGITGTAFPKSPIGRLGNRGGGQSRRGPAATLRSRRA